MSYIPLGILLLGTGLTLGCSSHCGEDRRIELPSEPLALSSLNSEFDDWNSCSSWAWWESGAGFLFSSNRGSQGGNFDLVAASLRLEGDGDVSSAEPTSNTVATSIASRVNSDADELGASFWFLDDSGQSGALVLSRGDSTNHDLIAYVAAPDSAAASYSLWESGALSSDLVEVSLSPLNSDQDEGYATWSLDVNQILFHSNRSGTYRIYSAVVTDTSTPFEWLSQPKSSTVSIQEVAELGSDGEERCPMLVDDTLYFISNRSGGQGGFDIYRSNWDGTSWSAPTNLGAKINASADEYRPFAISVNNPNDGLVFSSNRAGGKGGYDLYLVATGQ